MNSRRKSRTTGSRHAGHSDDLSNPNIQERNTLRRLLMDKSTEIGFLESQASKVGEYRRGLLRLMQDFQDTQQLNFVEDKEKFKSATIDTQECVQLVRSGINNLINYHEKLANRYELELSKNIFLLDQQILQKREELEREREHLRIEQDNKMHQEDLIQNIETDKLMIIKTIQMLRRGLVNHAEADQTRQAQMERKIQTAIEEYERSISRMKEAEDVEVDVIRKKEERLGTEMKQMEQHSEIVETYERLKRQVAKKAHAHNESASALVKAKEELVRLTRTVNSYHDNLKSQVMFDAEAENKRLRAVLNTESIDFSEKVEKHRKIGVELHSVIQSLQAEIDKLNVDISITEQKIQSQMMRIPDFPQLRAALDREMEQSKKYKEFVLKRKYFMDEIHERNRQIEQADIEESKRRVRALYIQIPDVAEEKEREKMGQLPKLLEESRKRTQELEAAMKYGSFM